MRPQTTRVRARGSGAARIYDAVGRVPATELLLGPRTTSTTSMIIRLRSYCALGTCISTQDARQAFDLLEPSPGGYGARA